MMEAIECQPYPLSAQVVHRLPQMVNLLTKDNSIRERQTSPTVDGRLGVSTKVIVSEHEQKIESLKTIIVALSSKLTVQTGFDEQLE